MKKILIAALSVIMLVCSLGLIACNANKETTATTLNAPTLNADGHTLNWNEIENASGYIVRINNDDYSANSCSYSLNGWKDGQYLCFVKAVGDNVNYLDSAFSASVLVEIKPTIIDTEAPEIIVSNTDIKVLPQSEVKLSPSTLGLTISDNSGKFNIEYEVLENGFDPVEIVDDSFATKDYGYYVVNVRVQDAAENKTEKQVVLIVQGTYLYTLNSDTSFSNWVSNKYGQSVTCDRELITEDNGNKYASFKHSKVTFNVILPNSNLVEGNVYDVYLTVWIDQKLTGAQTVTMETATDLKNASGKLTESNQKSIFYVQFTPKQSSAMRFCTFYFTNNFGATLNYNIDNIMVVPHGSIDITAPIVNCSNPVSVSANSEFTLNENNLGLSVVEASSYTINYSVKHNGQTNVAVKNGKFTATDGYYAVTATVTDEYGNSSNMTNIVAVDGVVFDDNSLYKMQSVPKQMPKTFEAWVYLNKTVSDKGGCIVGNFNYSKNCINYVIGESGAPYVSFGKNATFEVVFDQVDVRADDFVHLAIVRNGNNFSCYINGQLKQTKTLADEMSLTDVLVIGSDFRPQADRYFKGLIKSVAMYSDVRTENEIKADMTRADVADNNIIASYNLLGVENDNIEDLSSNKINVVKKYIWKDSVSEPENYDYSFAVIGDIQTMTNKHPAKLSKIFDYIIDNVESKKIKHVFGLGDITEYNTDEQWQVASSQILRLSGIVPYSFVRGNHDSFDKFNAYLGAGTGYANQQMQLYQEGDYNSTAHKFTAGSIDYLVLALDCTAGDAVLEWACDMIEANPDRKVIITTHAYSEFNGERLDEVDMNPVGPTDKNSYNNGNEYWEKLVSKYENIAMVLCGHVAYNNIVVTQSTGENGNIVQEVLVNPQTVDLALGDITSDGPAGLVAMFYVYNDGRVEVRYYSTVREKFYLEDNQFSFNLDV